MSCVKPILLLAVLLVLSGEMRCEEVGGSRGELVANELIEEGRTFVHQNIKRLAVILPAVFFKLGIAFSLLLLVTIVGINNGFIGFMLLVVGLGTVLAKLQEARRTAVPVPVPYFPPAPLAHAHFGHHQHFLDRSDDVLSAQQAKTAYSALASPGYGGGYAEATLSNPSYSTGSSYVGSLTNNAFATDSATGVVYGTRNYAAKA